MLAWHDAWPSLEVSAIPIDQGKSRTSKGRSTLKTTALLSQLGPNIFGCTIHANLRNPAYSVLILEINR